MLVQSCETLEGGFNVFGRDVAYFLSFENANEPPVAVAVVHQEEAVPFDDIRLTVHSSCKAMQSVHEVKVNGLIRNRERGRTVVVGMREKPLYGALRIATLSMLMSIRAYQWLKDAWNAPSRAELWMPVRS